MINLTSPSPLTRYRRNFSISTAWALRAVLCLLMLMFAVGNANAGAQNDVEVFPQLGHTEYISSLEFSPDGMQIVSGSWDYTLKLWDFTTGREIRTFRGHTGGVTSVTFSPDGRQILSGAIDGLKLWDTITGSEIRTFQASSLVSSVKYSPDGRQVFAIIPGENLRIWDATSGQEIRTIRTGHNSVSIALSPDGMQIVSGSHENTLKLFDVTTGREIRTFMGHTEGVISVSFSPDGRQIVSGAGDNTLKLWDVATGREIRTFYGHTGDHYYFGVYSVTFSPDGRQILSVGRDDTIKLWDTSTGREIRTFRGHSDRLIGAATFSPNGMHVLSGAIDGLKLWDIVTGSEIRSFSSNSNGSGLFVRSPDGRQILSATRDNTLILWDIVTGREIRAFRGHLDTIDSIMFSPDGSQIVSGARDNTLKLWDTATGSEIRTFRGHSNRVTSVAFSPDGRQLVSGSSDRTIKLWDAATGREIRTFSGHLGIFNLVRHVEFSPDGRQLLSTGNDRTLKLWDIASGHEIRSIMVQTAQSILSSVKFSPDGRLIFVGGPGYLGLFDTASGREIRSFPGYSELITSIAFSHDGRQILSGGREGIIKLWDTSTGRELHSFGGSTAVSSVAFLSDNSNILYDSEGAVRLLDISTGREIAQFISFDDGEWIVITPEGYYNASANGDKYLNVRVGNTVFGIDQYRATFFNPEVVTAQLASQNLASSQQNMAGARNNIQNARSFQPSSIIVESPAPGTTITTNTANFSVAVVDDNLPVTSIRLLVNGHLYHISEPNFQNFRWDGSFRPNQIGENHIEIVTSNGMSESRQRTTINWRPTNPPPPRRPDLYILAIGVDHYDNISNLSWCAADARGIVNAFRTQEGTMYNRVHTRIIADGESLLPTADNIRRNLSFLNQGTADDYFLLLFSGHGGDDGQGGFFFCPRDYSGRVPSSRINSDEILSVLNLPGRRMVFIDACHSGGVVGGQAINNDRLARVLKESNALVFTASRGVEVSWEMGRLQHGAFVYSIIKSLNEGPGGTVTMFDLARDTMRETVSITNGRQNPNLSALSFEDFPIAIRRTATASSPPPPRPAPPPAAANPPPSWTPPPPPPRPSTGQVAAEVLTELGVGLLRWGIQQLQR